MVAMFQVESDWTGFPGAPGYTNHFFEHSDPPSTGAQAAADNVRAFWNEVKGLFPSVVTITVNPLVKVIEAETGDLDSVITVGTPPAAVSGSAANDYAAPVGMCVNWATTTVHVARRVRGRTFLVPCADIVFVANGVPNSTFVTALNTAGTNLRTASGPTFGVWARPITNGPSRVPPVANRAGVFAPATANSVPSKAIVLRSRRD